MSQVISPSRFCRYLPNRLKNQYPRWSPAFERITSPLALIRSPLNSDIRSYKPSPAFLPFHPIPFYSILTFLPSFPFVFISFSLFILPSPSPLCPLPSVITLAPLFCPLIPPKAQQPFGFTRSQCIAVGRLFALFSAPSRHTRPRGLPRQNRSARCCFPRRLASPVRARLADARARL